MAENGEALEPELPCSPMAALCRLLIQALGVPALQQYLEGQGLLPLICTMRSGFFPRPLRRAAKAELRIQKDAREALEAGAPGLSHAADRAWCIQHDARAVQLRYWQPYQEDAIPDIEFLSESTCSATVAVAACDLHATVASVGAEDAEAAEGPSEAPQGHRVSH